MIRKVLLILISTLGCNSMWGQQITTSGTITDNDGQIWAGGTYVVRPVGQFYYNGTTSVSILPQTGTLDSSGSFSGLVLYNTTTLTPVNARYQWTICSKTSAPCSVFTSAVTTTNLSATLSGNLNVPRFPANYGAYGYNDTEVINVANLGAEYYNTLTGYIRLWTGSAWQNLGVASINQAQVNSAVTPCNFNAGEVTGCTGIDGIPIGQTTPAAIAATMLAVNATQATAGLFTTTATSYPIIVEGLAPNLAINSEVAIVPGVQYAGGGLASWFAFHYTGSSATSYAVMGVAGKPNAVYAYEDGGAGVNLTTPASSSSNCITGEFTFDSNFFYGCTSTNIWKRIALVAF